MKNSKKRQNLSRINTACFYPSGGIPEGRVEKRVLFLYRSCRWAWRDGEIGVVLCVYEWFIFIGFCLIGFPGFHIRLRLI